VRRTVIFAAALAMAIPAIGQAAASDDGMTRVRVSSAGLDLSRSGDAAVLAHRLEAATLQACGASEFSLRELRLTVRRSACFRDNLDRALAQLNAPAVNAHFAQAGGRD